MKKDKLNINSSVDKKERKLYLVCSICPPHKGENKANKVVKRNWKKFRKTKYKRAGSVSG